MCTKRQPQPPKILIILEIHQVVGFSEFFKIIPEENKKKEQFTYFLNIFCKMCAGLLYFNLLPVNWLCSIIHFQQTPQQQK